MDLGTFYALMTAITWGLVYAIDERILIKVSPAALLFANAIIMAIVILPVFYFDAYGIKDLFNSGKLNLTLIVLTAALGAFANFFIFSAIKSLGAPTATVIEITYPVFVVLFGFFLFRAQLNVYFFLGAALIFVGAFVIIRMA